MSNATSLTIFAGSGVETRRAQLQRARRRLGALGYSVTDDESTRYRCQRFAGSDEQRVATLHRVADAAPSVAMACRGGYGITRLLDALDWERIRRSVDRGTRWIGYSDMTAFSLALYAHTGAASWHGPMATEDFGRLKGSDRDQDEANDIACETFDQAMSGQLEAVGFRTGKGLHGLSTSGMLWGGNLTMVCSLLGTRHWPRIRQGILFLEDVGEHPYRVERMMLQLLQSGVLAEQSAVLLGQFTAWKPSPLDRGFGLREVWNRVAQECSVPLITGLPVGHVALNLTLPQGHMVDLHIDRQTAFLHFQP